MVWVRKMDKTELMKRLSEMSPEYVADMIRQALEDSGIPYVEDEGKVVFGGLDVECEVSYNFEFSINNDVAKRKNSYKCVRLKCDKVSIEGTDVYAADLEEINQTVAA